MRPRWCHLRAALRLQTTQPAVSAKLKRLRELTGDPLLVRAGHGMVPTPAALALMECQLGERPWCHGIHMSLADLAVGCALGYLDFRFPQLAWRERHPRLLMLHDKLMARPSFADTRPPQ